MKTWNGKGIDILEGCGMGPRTLQILRTYWDWLYMLKKVGGYFRPPFKGYHGVTQSDTFPQ